MSTYCFRKKTFTCANSYHSVGFFHVFCMRRDWLCHHGFLTLLFGVRERISFSPSAISSLWGRSVIGLVSSQRCWFASVSGNSYQAISATSSINHHAEIIWSRRWRPREMNEITRRIGQFPAGFCRRASAIVIICRVGWCYRSQMMTLSQPLRAVICTDIWLKNGMTDLLINAELMLRIWQSQLPPN